MKKIPTIETTTVNSKGEAEIKHHAPRGINKILVYEDAKIISEKLRKGKVLEVCKDDYNYLDYLPIIRFKEKYIGKEVLIQYEVERFVSQYGIYVDTDNYVRNLSNFKNKEYSFISFNKSGGIKKSKFKEIYSSFQNKPGGGLWASMYTPENKYISAWQLYIDSHRAEGVSPRKASRCAVLFNLKNDAKIPVIDSWEDYKKIENAFSYKKIHEKMGTPLPDDIPGDLIDYEIMSMFYDGIYVTKNGILDAGDIYWSDSWWNMVHRHEWETNLISFGCESLCLFNLDCIENKKQIKLEKW